MSTIPERLEKLRAKMQEKGIDIYIIPTADFHQSEYVGSILKQESILPDLRDLQEQQWFQRQKHACGQTEDTLSRRQSSWRNNSRTDEDGTARRSEDWGIFGNSSGRRRKCRI